MRAGETRGSYLARINLHKGKGKGTKGDSEHLGGRARPAAEPEGRGRGRVYLWWEKILGKGNVGQEIRCS